MFGISCRHLSMEATRRDGTIVVKDERTGLFRPTGRMTERIELGPYCNDAGKYVADMNYCPIQWDKAKKGKRYHG